MQGVRTSADIPSRSVAADAVRRGRPQRPLLDLDLTRWAHLIAADPHNAATTVLDAITNSDPDHAEVHLDPTPTPIPAPPIDQATIARHVEFFVRSGFLTPPPQHS